MKIGELKKKKACPAKLKRSGGFVLLFAVTLASILLAIALGISNIALKEVNFSTSARNSNDAFFAADTGAECALANDKSTDDSFVDSGSCQVQCLGGNISLDPCAPPSWSFTVAGLGSNGANCAKVDVFKEDSAPYTTTITSRGYNIGDGACDSSDPNRTERKLELTYSGNPPG